MTQAVHSAEGEDRSSYQKVGPWTSDAFGLAKATEATNWADPTFAENWANLRGERKPRGAYHFFHPEMNAVEQAEFFMSVLHKNGLEPGDMLVIDSEIIAGPGGILGFTDANWTERANVALSGTIGSPELVGSGTLTFLETVASLAGPAHPLLVYTNLSVGRLLGSCAHFDLWIAYPADSAPGSVAPWPRWRFWQWAFGGGEGGGDRDAYNGTVAELDAWISSFKPEPSPPPAPPAPHPPQPAPPPPAPPTPPLPTP